MKSTTTTYYLGIDICKAKLDVHAPHWKASRCFPNNPNGFHDLWAAIREIPGQPHIVCEPTGGYEQALLAEAFRRETSISAVNPRQVRDFARAKGQLAKTDSIDAAILTEYGEVFSPRPLQAPSALQRRLSAAFRRRESYKDKLIGEKNALEKITDAFVKKDIKAFIVQLTKRIERCDKHIAGLIASDPVLSEKKRKMEQIAGIGPGTSMAVLAEAPELGTISDKQASCLVGVAPLNRDSGNWRGSRSIHGGRSRVRRALYMPALCAAHHNPILKEFYQRLIAKNKPHHVALTAVIRKLVCLINRILADPDFKPS